MVRLVDVLGEAIVVVAVIVFVEEDEYGVLVVVKDSLPVVVEEFEVDVEGSVKSFVEYVVVSVLEVEDSVVDFRKGFNSFLRNFNELTVDKVMKFNEKTVKKRVSFKK